MRVLSWNIQWGRGMDGRVDLARIVSEIRRFGDFDIICLQEVAVNFPGLPGGAQGDQMTVLRYMFSLYGSVYFPITDVSDGRGGRSQFGNAVFSRLPISQVFRHSLPWPADPQVPSMQRGVLETVIETPFGPLRLMNTHFEYYSAIQRHAAIARIRELHEEVAQQAAHPRRPGRELGGPFDLHPRPLSGLLCGDLNFPPTAEERSRLLAPFANGLPAWRDAWSHLHGDQPHLATVGIHPVDFVDAPTCFDYMFLTEDLCERLVSIETDAESDASDHQPIWITLADD